MKSHMLTLIFNLAYLFLTCFSQENSPAPSFPVQFSAKIKITAHLIEESNEYPPRIRKMSVLYDYMNKRARADIDEGYEAAKTCNIGLIS